MQLEGNKRRTLILVLPDYAALLSQEINAGLIPAALKTIQRLGKKTHWEAGLTRTLFSLFSKHPLEMDLPLLSVLKPELAAQGGILMSPCIVQPDRDTLRLFSLAEDTLTESESMALLAHIKPLLAPMRGQLIDAATWALLPPSGETIGAVKFNALTDVAGQSVTDFLPQGADAVRWLSLWNEIQMSLHDCPVNQQREQDDKPSINSIWFWGQGGFNPTDNRWQHVAGAAPYLIELVKASGTGISTSIPHISGAKLTVLSPLSMVDSTAQLAELTNILTNALAELRWGKLRQLTVIVPTRARFTLSPRTMWRL